MSSWKAQTLSLTNTFTTTQHVREQRVLLTAAPRLQDGEQAAASQVEELIFPFCLCHSLVWGGFGPI